VFQDEATSGSHDDVRFVFVPVKLVLLVHSGLAMKISSSRVCRGE